LARKIPGILAGNLAFPDHRHLKSYSPQVPAQDNEKKAGIFPGKVLIVGHGKLYAVRISSKMGCEGVRCHLCLTHYHQAVLVWCF
jgi:hypothetical protein